MNCKNVEWIPIFKEMDMRDIGGDSALYLGSLMNKFNQRYEETYTCLEISLSIITWAEELMKITLDSSNLISHNIWKGFGKGFNQQFFFKHSNKIQAKSLFWVMQSLNGSTHLWDLYLPRDFFINYYLGWRTNENNLNSKTICIWRLYTQSDNLRNNSAWSSRYLHVNQIGMRKISYICTKIVGCVAINISLSYIFQKF